MTEETQTTEAPAEVEETTEAVETEETEAQEEATEPKTYSEDYVKKLNAENASWRVKYREAQEMLAKAKSPEDYEALEQKLASVQHQYERDQWIASATRSLPADLVQGLSWPDDEDAIKAMAESLSKHVTVTTISSDNLNGGLNPRKRAENQELSPGELARRYNSRVRK